MRVCQKLIYLYRESELYPSAESFGISDEGKDHIQLSYSTVTLGTWHPFFARVVCTRDTACQLLCRHRNTTPGAVLAGALTDASSLPNPSPSGPHEQDSERESGLSQRQSSASVLILRAHGRARLESGRRVPSSVTAAAVAYPTQCRT